MSLWTRIAKAVSSLAGGESLADVFERLRTPPERSVAFTIAVIALGAKMAKADGQVTRDEVAAFRQIFLIPKSDEANAARVFNLARQDVTGFDAYARKVQAMFGSASPVLKDLLEGLFQIAIADGEYHPNEDAFLREVAAIFGFNDAYFTSLRGRFVPDAPQDPFAVLGVTPDTPPDEIRKAWRQAVRETHPDRLMARGVPVEAVKLAERRLTAINRAWEEINARPKG